MATRKIINIDELAEMFKLPTWDKVDEYNQENYWAASKGVEGEEAQQQAESDERDEVFHKWYDAVLFAAENLFEKHGLRLVPRKKGDRPFEYVVLPKTTWRAAAEAIRQTINGAGPFYYSSVKEFVYSVSEPNARGAALSHLHWIKDQPAVYGDTNAERLYEQHWR